MPKALVKGLSRFLCLVIFVACLPQMAFAATAIEEGSAIFLENEYLKLKIVSHGKEGGVNKGGVISSLIYKPTGLDLTGMVNADRGGLLRERIPPIADLWAELTYEAEIVVNTEDRVTALVKSIPSDKSKGVETKKYITLRKGSTSIETKWEITNNGSKNFAITPWLWNNVIPGKTEAANYYFPTNKEGLYKNAPSLSKPPTRNWLGAIDEKNGISISFIADYNKLAMNYTWLGRSAGYTTQEWLYTTIDLAPGESWDTTFYTNVVPLQKENDLAYASPEVTVGIKKWKGLKAETENTLEIVLSSVEAMGNAEMEIEITGPDGYTFTAPDKFNVNLSNATPATINWTWTPPQEGVYLLKAGLYKGGIKQQLGKSLQNPSPDIEIPLVAGTYAEDTILFPAWPRKSSGGGGSEQRKISGAILSKETDMVVWSVPSLEKIFLDDIVDLENSPVKEQVTVDLAKREREAFQVVLSPEKGKDFNGSYVTFGEFKNEKGNLLPEGSLTYNPVGYVRTELGSRFDPTIRTGYWPDPLLETKKFDVKGGQNTPIWITVYTAPNVEEGIYKGNLTIKTDAETIVTLPMSINVWSFSLPEMPKLKTALDIRNVPAQQIDLYIDNFLEHRITPRIALRYPSVASLKQDTDFVQFDAKMERLLKKGLNTLSVGRDLYTDPELAKKFVEHLKAKGWLDMAYVYLTDEPTEETFPAVKELAAKWKAIVPELKIMITTYPKEKLVGAVDLWTVPGMNDDPQEAKKALERGEELWWYHTDPLHPQANFLIDMPAVDARAAFWQSWQGFINKGYTGFLYAWSTWAGKEDPWKITGPFFYRNGLESQIYPSPNGPVNSIRWEVMRDGVEDYDYCSLLWDLLQRVEKEMPGKVNEKEIVKAKNLLEFPVPLTDYVGKQNIVEETGKWRKEVAESIITITAMIKDTQPPVTSAQLQGTQVNGWYTNDVTLVLSAADAISQVAKTEYSLDDGSVWQLYTAPVPFDRDGRYNVSYRSTDSAGNVESAKRISFEIDKTAPITTASVSEIDGLNGWHVSNPTVTLAAYDSGSGAAQTLYRINGGSWLTYTQPVVIADEGIHNFEFKSIDRAGNEEAVQSRTNKLDKTPPTLHVVLDKTVLWPANHKMVTVTASVYADDAISQIDSVVLTSITSDEPVEPQVDIEAQYGTLVLPFMLRAERSGSGSGRIYTITYTATDKAGNKTSASATVKVPHDQSENNK
ncbi:DUF4091 domain-containing protein [Paenibacillus mesophilus]|uniref:OmpL47-type beta-barrel domain-containing protein n=1 Tax=Paenibacillus mesophilus TaxID=2582849 RepID=UPI00110F0B29|nr:glycoside hydrolase domain-containing protein [Paenibacillus mesophilus]TMV43202.1 DUF4091 domain-containing protein [Paenibacillus mesophilus]